MRIDLDKIPLDGIQLESKESPKILDISVEGAKFNSSIDVSVFAEKTGSTLILKGWLKTKVEFTCGRCLKNFSALIENKNLNYTYDITGLSELDITEDLREEIVLLVPLKPLCKKGCKGFCQHCGKNLNEEKCSCKTGREDIRWSELNKIKLKKDIKFKD